MVVSYISSLILLVSSNRKAKRNRMDIISDEYTIDKYIAQAEERVVVIDNKDYTHTVKSFPYGPSRVEPVKRGQIIHAGTGVFVYDEDKSITFGVLPFVNRAESIAYNHAREKYNFFSESEYYHALQKKEEYPPIDIVLKEVRHIVAYELFFNDKLKLYGIEKLNEKLCFSERPSVQESMIVMFVNCIFHNYASVWELYNHSK